MKRFLQSILMVLGLLVVFSIPFDHALSNYLSHSKTRKYVVWNDIIYDSINADLLVLGSSRALNHYNTYIMDSTLNINSYNLGIDGSTLNRQILRYDLYYHYQTHVPDIVLINIDYCSTLQWSFGFEREQFFPYFNKQYAIKEIKEKEPFSAWELYMPMFRYYKYGVYSTIMDEKSDITLYKGYGGRNWEWDGAAFSEINKYHFNKMKKAEKEFDLFLRRLKGQNIKVVFVYAPIYIGLTNIVDNLSEFYEVFQSYSDKYQIPILDYTYNYLSYDTLYFFNAMHLNQTGAALFTTQLCHDLDSIEIIKK